jgi:membrane protein YdbS with pleckstrin-like domain
VTEKANDRSWAVVVGIAIICGSALIFALGYGIWSYNYHIDKAAVERGMVWIDRSWVPVEISVPAKDSQ